MRIRMYGKYCDRGRNYISRKILTDRGAREAEARGMAKYQEYDNGFEMKGDEEEIDMDNLEEFDAEYKGFVVEFDLELEEADFEGTESENVDSESLSGRLSSDDDDDEANESMEMHQWHSVQPTSEEAKAEEAKALHDRKVKIFRRKEAWRSYEETMMDRALGREREDQRHSVARGERSYEYEARLQPDCELVLHNVTCEIEV